MLSNLVFDDPAILRPSARNRAFTRTITGLPFRSSRTVVLIVDGRGTIASYASPAVAPAVRTRTSFRAWALAAFAKSRQRLS